jgi:hypothetical protein
VRNISPPPEFEPQTAEAGRSPSPAPTNTLSKRTESHFSQEVKMFEAAIVKPSLHISDA